MTYYDDREKKNTELIECSVYCLGVCLVISLAYGMVKLAMHGLGVLFP